MIKKLQGEVWKNLQFPGWKDLRKKYAVSNQGRVSSYTDDIHEDGKLLKLQSFAQTNLRKNTSSLYT